MTNRLRRVLRASLVAAFSIVAATPIPFGNPSALAEENQEQSVRKALDEGARLLNSGHPREALAVLEDAERVEPDNPWLLFYQGRAQSQLGDAYKAIRSFDRASALLAGSDDPNETRLAKRIEDERCRARRQVFNISYGAGLAYDTNVTFLGDQTAGPTFVSGRSDGKFGSDFQINYAPVATRQEALTVGARVADTWNFHVEDFNYQDYGGYVRYARRLGEDWQAAIQYDYDLSYLGNEPFLSDHAVTPSLTYSWHGGRDRFALDQTQVYYRFDAQDYLYPTTPAFDPDALANGVGVEQSFLLRPLAHSEWTWRLSGGYQFSRVSTEGTEYDRFEHNFNVGAQIPLINPADGRYLILPDKELFFTFRADWLLGDYRNRSLLDADRDPRFDQIATFAFGLSQKLIENPRYGDMWLHLLIQYTDADSNVGTRGSRYPYRTGEPFSYNRTVYGVQLEWSW